MTYPGNDMIMWVVYDCPSDYPGLYVARKTVNGFPTRTLVTSETLDGVRDRIRFFQPYRLTKIARSPGDDPVIVETWL